jgi:ribonuclease HI
MVVEQMSGRWKAKGGLYLPYYRQAWDAAGRMRGLEFEWVPRKENMMADKLSKDVLRAMGVEFRLQPE